ncbi:MAG: nitrile hydratase accessory protein [Magnetovibrio sp.]|nr:nitrile hydratase accessory protein [Magnetovibrio sp.]
MNKKAYDLEEPVFDEPWQAQVFALAVKLSEDGLFTWKQWTAAISYEIQNAQISSDPDLGDTYYEHWLNALERLVYAKGVLNIDEMTERKEAWRKAYLQTPHGIAVQLKKT